MAFPNLVTAAALLTESTAGPYEISPGTVYQPLTNNAVTLVQMWKSTDSGVTWAKVGIDPSCGFGGGAVSSCTDGGKIYVLSVDPTLLFEQISIFDTTTDTWTSTTVTGNAVQASNVAAIGYRASDKQLIVTAPVVAFQFAANDIRCGYFLFDAAAHTWGPWTRCGFTMADPGVAWNVFSVLQGSGNAFWFVFLKGPAVLPNGIYSVVIQSLTGNALGPLTTIASNATIAPNVAFLKQGFSDGIHAIVAWQPDNSIQSLTVLEAPVGTMAFTSQIVSAAAGFIIEDWAVMCSTAAGFVLFIASDNGVSFPVDYYVDSGMGFAAKTNLGSHAVNVILANKITSQPWGIVINGSTFYWQLLGPPPPPPLKTSQVAFMGVRRMKGSDPLRPAYQFQPKPFIYNASIALTLPAVDGSGNAAPPQSLRNKIVNYDFELYELRFRYRSAAGVFLDPKKPAAKLWIYDPVSQQISNAPILDIYVNGAPSSAYQNGALVPPLLYPKQSQVRIDFFSLITNALLLPVTCYVDIVGVQRIPCD